MYRYAVIVCVHECYAINSLYLLARHLTISDYFLSLLLSLDGINHEFIDSTTYQQNIPRW